MPSDRELQALIEEARARQRRRRRRVVVALLLAAAGAGVLIAGGGSGGSGAPSPTTASAGAIRAFVAKASRGIGGTYTLTYLASVRYSWGVRQVNVIAAQRSPDRFFYRETPSLEVSSPGGPAASHSYEVFVLGRPSSRPGAGLYSCRQALPGSRWACRGPFTGIGMGGTNELLGPYPPQALVIGLQNAVVVYEAREPTRPATRRKPAFLFTRRVAGQNLRCLAFGPIPRPLGEACLDRSGIIAYYRLPQSFTYGAYDTVTLLAYSPRTVAASFKLPASVARVRPSAP